MKEPLPKFFTVAVVSGIVLVVLYWCLVHVPFKEKYSAAQKELIALERDYMNIRRYLSQHQDLAKHKHEAKAAKLLADELVPDALNESEFLRYLTERTDLRQMEVISVLPGQAIVDGDGFTALPVQIHLRTDYWQLTDFLADLEKSTRFVSVQGIKLVTTDNGLECRLTLTVYACSFAHVGRD